MPYVKYQYFVERVIFDNITDVPFIGIILSQYKPELNSSDNFQYGLPNFKFLNRITLPVHELCAKNIFEVQ
jgi:hypothetical protein